MLLRSKTRLTGKGKPPILPKANTRSVTKGKTSLSSKQSEYCDGHCQQFSKKQTLKQTDKTPVQEHTYMSASDDSTNIGDELPPGGELLEQISDPNIEDQLPAGGEHSEHSSETNPATMSVTFDELAKLLLEQHKQTAKQISEQNEYNATQLTSHLTALAKSLDKPQPPTPPAGSNNIKYPTFSGTDGADVNTFIRDLNSATTYQKQTSLQKAELFPMCLRGAAKSWFQSATHLAGKPYDQLCDALIRKFHTESDIWLLEQQLTNKNQLPSESITQYATRIRTLCQRLGTSDDEHKRNFLTGLRPEIRNYVMLQRPKTLDEAETLAKMKEALPDEKSADKTEEILKLLKAKLDEPKVAAYNVPFQSETAPLANYAQERPLTNSEIMQLIKQERCAREPAIAAYNPYTNRDMTQASFQYEKPLGREDVTEILRRELSSFEPKVAAYNTPFTSGHTQRPNYPHSRPLGRDDITQIIRNELRRAKNQGTQGQDYRNRRSLDGKPICNYCKKIGHVAYVCRKRQYDNRDPRIPAPDNRQPGPNRRQEGNMGNPAPQYTQQNLN